MVRRALAPQVEVVEVNVQRHRLLDALDDDRIALHVADGKPRQMRHRPRRRHARPLHRLQPGELAQRPPAARARPADAPPVEREVIRLAGDLDAPDLLGGGFAARRHDPADARQVSQRAFQLLGRHGRELYRQTCYGTTATVPNCWKWWSKEQAVVMPRRFMTT
jgi:hypothetical protein